jgi:hypothetical protein
MIDCKGSVIVNDQGSHDRLAGVPVVPDRGGQGQDALQDPDDDAGDGAATVLFEVELAFEGVVDRLDVLSYGPQQATTGAGRLGAVCGAYEGYAGFIESGLGVTVAVALVHDQDQPVRVVEHVRLQGDQVDEDFSSSALALLSANATGRPCTVVTRCSRRPQKSLECEAQ